MLDDTTPQDSAVVAMDLLSDSIDNASENRQHSVLDVFVKAIADAVNPQSHTGRMTIESALQFIADEVHKRDAARDWLGLQGLSQEVRSRALLVETLLEFADTDTGCGDREVCKCPPARAAQAVTA